MAPAPLVTVAVPSLNQGRYLGDALESIFRQDVPVEVFVADGGSTDGTLDEIRRWEPHLAGWRSHPDSGQSAAINECIAKGSAPLVCWLNSDDWLLPGGLTHLALALDSHPDAAMAYGRAWNHVEGTSRERPAFVRPFSERLFANFCVISQPATLIRRKAWEAVGGLDEGLRLAMDYDLWWRLYKSQGPPVFVSEFVATNRDHADTKTNLRRAEHYREAIAVVRNHYGRVPLKWWLAQPFAVWYRTLLAMR